MKCYLLLCLIPLLACTTEISRQTVNQQDSDVVLQYQNKIKNCDTVAKHSFNQQNLSTAQLNNISDTQIKCYQEVANTIIDTIYSNQSEIMKSKLNEYIKLCYKVNLDTYWPDSCYPTCGSMTTTTAYADTLENAKQYLNLLLSNIQNN